MNTNHATRTPALTPPTVYLASDQPVTCPKCDARTESVNEDGDERCLNKACRYVFRVEFDTTT